MRSPGRGRERGAATVLVVALASVVMVVGVALAGATGLVVAHRRAQAAADLAALGAAEWLRRGPEPCGVAAEVAERNGARLRACVVRAGDVHVSVGVAAPGAVPWPVELTGRARAGPAASAGR